MALPTLTPEQRQAALAKAAEARAARTALLAKVKAGELTFAQLLERDDDIAKKIKVSQALRAVKGVGPAKATALMEEAGLTQAKASFAGDTALAEEIARLKQLIALVEPAG